MALSSMLRGWLQRSSDLRALDALGPDARQGLASDLGITEPALCRIAANGPGASEELPKLLEGVSLDPERLRAIHPAVLRDMEVVCAECDAKSRCRTDLNLGIAAATYDEYCRNAETIDALRQEDAAMPKPGR
jgi:hypothetical protein